MYSVEVSVVNLDEANSSEFDIASQAFVEELQSIPDLEVSVQQKQVEGTRGAITLITGIIITGINLGIFSALYTIAKDLYSRYHNSEVQLKFKDGSILVLKSLTQEEAEQKIREHLRKQKNH
jgi:hypothetical protein